MIMSCLLIINTVIRKVFVIIKMANTYKLIDEFVV